MPRPRLLPGLRHPASSQVTEDIEEMRFNTGIAAMMEFTNGAYKWDSVPKAAMEPFVLLLSPLAPHIAEELWQVGTAGLQKQPWNWLSY